MIRWAANCSMSVALFVATSLSGFITYEDWRNNPGGIFQTEEGTQWPYVIDTFASWFFPTAVMIFIALFVLVIGFLWLRRRAAEEYGMDTRGERDE
jgi:cytochrome bd-type quinol oxidase subunit 1